MVLRTQSHCETMEISMMILFPGGEAMRAAVYARVSTKAQAEKEASIPEQVEKCTELARSLGSTQVTPYVDEGFSGADSSRPALRQLLEDTKAGRYVLVVCYSVDRWARDLADQLACAREIERFARLEFVTHPMGHGPEDVLFFQMRGAFAQFERALIRQRTAMGRRRKADKGQMVIPSGPFGYRYNGDKEAPELFLHETEAAVVRKIFAMVVDEGLGKEAIRRRLWAEGCPSPKGSKTWGVSTIGRILRNPTYKGEFYNFKWRTVNENGRSRRVARNQSEWRMVKVPAIVSPAIWEQAQERLKENGKVARRGRKYEYLLTGMCFCGHCGRRLMACPQYGRPWYRCTGKRVLTEPCSAPMVPALSKPTSKGIDDVVWAELLTVLTDPRMVLKAVENAQSRIVDDAPLQEKESQLQSRLSELDSQKQELFDLRLDGLITAEDLRQRLQLIDAHRRDLDAELDLVARQRGTIDFAQLTPSNLAELVEWARQIADTTSLEDRRRILQRLRVRVTVFQAGQIEIVSCLPLGQVSASLQPDILSNLRGRRPSGRGRARVSGAGPRRRQERWVALPTPTDHRQSGSGLYTKGGGGTGPRHCSWRVGGCRPSSRTRPGWAGRLWRART